MPSALSKKINNISSGEAIKMLASRAGMPEPQEDDKTGRLRSRVLSMNKGGRPLLPRLPELYRGGGTAGARLLAAARAGR